MDDIFDPNSIDGIIAADGRYCIKAFEFLHDGLEYAVKNVHGYRAEFADDDEFDDHESSHVSGQQLCLAMRDLAKKRWGMLAKAVLNKWGIHKTQDFGNMVYLLIEHDFMDKNPEDTIEDFDDVFDFTTDLDVSQDISMK